LSVEEDDRDDADVAAASVAEEDRDDDDESDDTGDDDEELDEPVDKDDDDDEDDVLTEGEDDDDVVRSSLEDVSDASVDADDREDDDDEDRSLLSVYSTKKVDPGYLILKYSSNVVSSRTQSCIGSTTPFMNNGTQNNPVSSYRRYDTTSGLSEAALLARRKAAELFLILSLIVTRLRISTVCVILPLISV